MSESKISFHSPVPRDPSSAGEIIPVPPASVQVVRARSNSQAKSGSGQGMNSQFVLNALRRWWKLALPAGLMLAAGAVAIVYWQFEPQYEAAALLEITERPDFIAFEPKDGVSKSYFRTQMEIIKNRWILGRTVAKDEIQQLPEFVKISTQKVDPIDWLKKRVSVVSPSDSDLFEIRYSGADPKNAALLVNVLTREYLTAQEEEAANRAKKIVDALAEEMASRKKLVGTLRSQVQTAQQAVAGKEPELARPDPNSPAKNPLSELQARLVTVQVEHAMLSARIKAGEAELDAAEKEDAAKKVGTVTPAVKPSAAPLSADEIEMRDHMIQRAMAENTEVRQQESQIAALRTRLKMTEKKVKQGKKDPLYQMAEKEILTLEESLKELKNSLKPAIQEEVEFTLRMKRSDGGVAGIATPNRRREELARMKTELSSYDIAEKNLRNAYAEELKKFLTELEKLSGENLNLTFKKDELVQAQKVLERITERQIALQTERAAPPRVILHHPADAPTAPVEAVPYRNMALAGLAGLFLPFALVVGWEGLMRRIGGCEDLEQQMHLAVLGEIPRLPMRSRAASRLSEAKVDVELRVFQESIDSLRLALTLSEDLRDMRILAITSAANHEGKTSLASQLALSLARSTGKTTLLIDGDMRSPDVHRVFGVAQEPGLAEVLNAECPLADAIVPTHSEHVHLLPAGHLKTSPHRLLGNGSWKSLLEQIPESYRYVIIDTPPVLAASEALVLAKAADATLLCVMRDVSRGDQVRKASERLVTAGGNPVGMVLSGVPTSRYTYSYGSYPSPATR
jgi:polysaccharide biosynthesis transport protein